MSEEQYKSGRKRKCDSDSCVTKEEAKDTKVPKREKHEPHNNQTASPFGKDVPEELFDDAQRQAVKMLSSAELYAHEIDRVHWLDSARGVNFSVARHAAVALVSRAIAIERFVQLQDANADPHLLSNHPSRYVTIRNSKSDIRPTDDICSMQCTTCRSNLYKEREHTKRENTQNVHHTKITRFLMHGRSRRWG